MKKMRRFLTVLVAILMVTATPAMAGRWGYEGDNPSSTYYLKDDGTFASYEYLTIDGVTYYFDITGYLLTNNYAPDGNWIDSNGTIDPSVPKLENFPEYPRAAIYSWSDEYEYRNIYVYFHDDFDDGLSIAEVKIESTIPSHMQYTSEKYLLIKMDDGTFLVTDKDYSLTNNMYVVMKDRNTMIVSYMGETKTYYYTEPLIYS